MEWHEPLVFFTNRFQFRQSTATRRSFWLQLYCTSKWWQKTHTQEAAMCENITAAIVKWIFIHPFVISVPCSTHITVCLYWKFIVISSLNRLNAILPIHTCTDTPIHIHIFVHIHAFVPYFLAHAIAIVIATKKYVYCIHIEYRSEFFFQHTNICLFIVNVKHSMLTWHSVVSAGQFPPQALNSSSSSFNIKNVFT